MRDDIDILPLPSLAKRYARRKGLKSMLRQPKDYINMIAQATNQLPDGFPNKDAAGPVARSFKESAKLVEALLS